MSEARRNPYRRVARALHRIGWGLLLLIAAIPLAIIFFVFPVIRLMDGQPWYDALAPWLMLGGLAVFTVVLVLIGEFVVRPIVNWWQARERRWDLDNSDRKQ